jgi:short-subunit dehydrogenase
VTGTAIIGATAGLGRSLALQAAACGQDLLLVATDERDLDAMAAHLHLVHGVHVETRAANLVEPGSTNEVLEHLTCWQGLRHLLLPAGMALDTDDETIEVEDARRLVEANLTSISLLALRGFSLMRERGGSIVGFGSVAAIRGRRRNLVYAAAKRGLTSVFEGLQHAAGGSRVRVQLYQLGFLKTQNSYGIKTLLPPAEPRSLARRVFRDIDREIGVVSYPRYWSVIALLVRLIPLAVYRRLDF